MFLCQSSFFFCQIGNLRFALEQRGCADFAASRENDSLSRNVFAGERGHRQSRFYLFALERLFEFRKNDDVAEQTRDECFQRFRCLHLVSGPRERLRWQNFLRRLRRGRCQVGDKQRGVSQLFFFRCPIISETTFASFKMTACRLRPSAASIA